MGVRRYRLGKKTYWIADFRVQLPDGTSKRIIKRRIPTKEMAEALESKYRSAAFEGKHFERRKNLQLTVKQAWELFRPYAEETHKSVSTTRGRAEHVVRHLGSKDASRLTHSDVVKYRQLRRNEITYRKTMPSTSTLNREISLLRRILNYAVQCKRLSSNPLRQVQMLREDDVRNVDITNQEFQSLVNASEEPLRTFLLIARDTGMRKSSILKLRRSQIEMSKDRAILRLGKGDVKQHKAQTVVLTLRSSNALKEMLESHNYEWVFANPATKKPYVNIRAMYLRTLKKVDLEKKGYWIHDQSRKFATEARRAVVDESTIMSMTGHKTRSAFERYNIVSTADQRRAIEQIEVALENELGQQALLSFGFKHDPTVKEVFMLKITREHFNNLYQDLHFKGAG